MAGSPHESTATAETLCCGPSIQGGLEETLAEIASLANALCEHLADEQWETANRIRDLAELATTPSDSPGAS